MRLSETHKALLFRPSVKKYISLRWTHEGIMCKFYRLMDTKQNYVKTRHLCSIVCCPSCLYCPGTSLYLLRELTRAFCMCFPFWIIWEKKKFFIPIFPSVKIHSIAPWLWLLASAHRGSHLLCVTEDPVLASNSGDLIQYVTTLHFVITL